VLKPQAQGVLKPHKHTSQQQAPSISSRHRASAAGTEHQAPSTQAQAPSTQAQAHKHKHQATMETADNHDTDVSSTNVCGNIFKKC
jgi:hypothetical protein